MIRDGHVPRISALFALAALASCGGLDEDEAGLMIREQLCSEWPAGCSDSTRIDVRDVRKAGDGRQVDFRIVDREDRTPTLSAAYFEETDGGWDLLMFEGEFRRQLDERAGRFDADRRSLTDQLMELKAAQKWFLSIYGRYARSLAELDSVSYKPPQTLEMDVEQDGSAWQARMATEVVDCELDEVRQLPDCEPKGSEGVGTKKGPLSREFSED